MIKSLTKQQEFKFKQYVDKWKTIGLSTDRITLEQCKPIVDRFYKKILKKETVPIIIMDSPIGAWLATLYVACLFGKESQVGAQVGAKVGAEVGAQVWTQVWDQVGDQVWAQIRDQVGDQVETQVWDQVWDQVGAQVGDQVWDQVGGQVGAQVRDQVWDQVGDQVWAQIRDQVGDQVETQVWDQVGDQVWAQIRDQVGAQVGAQVKNFIWPYVSGNLWSGWFSFYDFMFSAVIKLETPLFTDLKEMSKLHLVYPLDQACVLSQKPIEINMTNGLLHKDGAPSIKYADGFSVWSLNGVRVPQELAETPTEKLSMEFFKKETNSDIRAEFIRKFGIQRMVSLGRVVDSVTEESGEWERRSEYQLIAMGKVYEIPYAPHLKMKNLTTGIYHMEGVDPTCKTVQDAIKYRCGGKKVMIAGIK